MFSGIIEKKARILSIRGGEFTVENPFDPAEMTVGESISHDGACMTILEFDEERYSFFVMEESLKRTNFIDKQSGDFFNLERSIRFGGKLDGHFVTGHVDSTGRISRIIPHGDGSRTLYVEFNPESANLVIEKGSIAVNGTSLTVIEAGEHTFSVGLIPLTQEATNLGDLHVGDRVNLEFDLLGKYILRHTSLIPR